MNTSFILLNIYSKLSADAISFRFFPIVFHKILRIFIQKFSMDSFSISHKNILPSEFCFILQRFSKKYFQMFLRAFSKNFIRKFANIFNQNSLKIPSRILWKNLSETPLRTIQDFFQKFSQVFFGKFSRDYYRKIIRDIFKNSSGGSRYSSRNSFKKSQRTSEKKYQGRPFWRFFRTFSKISFGNFSNLSHHNTLRNSFTNCLKKPRIC